MLYSSSTLFWGRSVLEMAKALETYHLTGIEFWYEQAQYFNLSPKEIADVFSSYSQARTVHAASWDLNLSSINRGVRQQSLEEIEKSLHFAKLLQADDVTIHPGRHSSISLLDDWHREQMLYSVAAIDQLAQQYEMPVSFELMEPIRKEMYTTPAQLNELLEACSDWVYTTYDVAHSSLGEEPERAFLQLKRVNKIHMSDSTPLAFHVPVGQGEIQWSRLMPYILNKKVPLILEGFDVSEDEQFLRAHLAGLRHLEQTSERREQSV